MDFHRLPYVLIAFGLALGGLMLAEIVATVSSPIPFNIPVIANFASSLPFIVVLLAVGYWLLVSEVDRARYRRIGGWVLGGLAFFLIFALLAAIGQPDWLGRIAIMRWGASIGSGIGLIVGVFEARAIDRAIVAERERMRRKEVQRANDRLEEFARTIAHDLRNPLNVASGYIDSSLEQDQETRLDATASALERMEQIIEGTLTLARSGQVIADPESVSLAVVAERAWQHVETDEATLEIGEVPPLTADPDRLQQLFENLFRNAVEHAGPRVTVRVGGLTNGFFVEDDGPGIPMRNRAEVLDAGFTTDASGTGLGLSIGKQIADAHGWELEVTESETGGARFEFTGIDVVQSTATSASVTVDALQ